MSFTSIPLLSIKIVERSNTKIKLATEGAITPILSVHMIPERTDSRDSWWFPLIPVTPVDSSDSRWFPVIPGDSWWFPAIPGVFRWFPLIPDDSRWFPSIPLILVSSKNSNFSFPLAVKIGWARNECATSARLVLWGCVPSGGGGRDPREWRFWDTCQFEG